jgi:uncharacterized protein involved in propanediol utilization
MVEPGLKGNGVRRLRELHVVAAELGVAQGIGWAPAHHGELLQGTFAQGDGRTHRALVTLPLPHLGSNAVFHPSQDHWGVIGTPELAKVRRAAARALREFGSHPGTAKGGHIEITSDVPRGIGMGSSTSDVTATIRAVANYHGVFLSPEEVGRLAVAAECASDSIMIDDRVVLFAHRDGLVLETFGPALPSMIVLGCDTDPGRVVDTLAMRPAEHDEHEVAAFGVLRAALRRAIALGDVGLLGRVATASTVLNERYLPKPRLAELLALLRTHGGCGIQVAHSGTVAGLIFAPGARDAALRCRDAVQAMGLPITCLIGIDQTTTEREMVTA